MEMQILGLCEKKYRYNLEHLAMLFFDEVTIHFTKQSDVPMQFLFSLSESKHDVVVKGNLIVNGNNEFAETVNFNKNEVEQAEKKAINYVYLKLLQAYTNIEQPWGTLIGVRPTKLVHQMRKSGLRKEEIIHRLKNIYLVTEEKIALLEKIVDKQLKVIPDLYSLENEVSIYIGIPFCPTKCAYCTFPAYAIGAHKNYVTPFLQRLFYEMEQIGKWLKEQQMEVTTIYFGGGTPTSISAEEMDLLYRKLYEVIPNIHRVREITVEAGRPDTITEDKINVLKKWKIDRISINPQSFQNETLRAIGRHHTVEETIEKFKLARACGMNNINMDLIIGLPGEGITEIAHTLKKTEELMPESLTVHTLSFKRASTITKEKEKYKVASRDEITKMMNMTTTWTSQYNYEPYYLYRQKNILGNLENVGYALEGKESLYNIIIMEESQTIIGLGCGATSKFIDSETGKITRFANAKDPHTYIERYEYYTEEKINRLNKIFCK